MKHWLINFGQQFGVLGQVLVLESWYTKPKWGLYCLLNCGYFFKWLSVLFDKGGIFRRVRCFYKIIVNARGYT